MYEYLQVIESGSLLNCVYILESGMDQTEDVFILYCHFKKW